MIFEFFFVFIMGTNLFPFLGPISKINAIPSEFKIAADKLDFLGRTSLFWVTIKVTNMPASILTGVSII